MQLHNHCKNKRKKNEKTTISVNLGKQKLFLFAYDDYTKHQTKHKRVELTESAVKKN